MLNSLTLENFRAFRSEHVRFSKLNVFVGPNNSGKSSIISAINLIAQNSIGGPSEYSLVLNGSYTDLGTYYDVVHGHNSRSRIKLGFSIGNFDYEYKFRYRPQRREIQLIRFSVSDIDKSFVYSTNDDKSTQQYIDKKLKPQPHEITKTRIRFRGLYMTFSLLFSPISHPTLPLELSRSIRDFTFRAMRVLEQHFSTFDSVGAFRAAPERTYHYTGEAPATVGRYGENFAQMLASGAGTRERTDTNVLRRAAGWFRAAGVAKDVQINSLTKRHFELQIEDETGAKNNISDSGFGCSQVLPVLVAGYNLSKNKRPTTPSMFVVQEPEINLHPTAAAHLGTYFTELAVTGTQCFVETHSENVILRIARHVALGHLSPKDVRIYWVSVIDGTHKAVELRLKEDGTFIDDWPAGFFPTRASETMQLARAASGISSQDEFQGMLFND